MSNLLKILLILGLATLCFSNLHLNVKYRNFLNGVGSFDESAAREIYSQFTSVRGKSEYRFKVFVDTLKEIRAHNQGKHTWTQGINDYSDMTFEEFKADKLMAPQNCSATNSFKIAHKGVSIPESYEWASTGMVSPVKNQGSCGSCWSFSTTGALEGLSKLSYGTLESFSEQQLVDCSGSYGNQACNGGLMDNAFKYVRDHGIVQESEYPYKAVKQTCQKTAGGPFKISGFVDIKDCNTLAN